MTRHVMFRLFLATFLLAGFPTSFLARSSHVIAQSVISCDAFPPPAATPVSSPANAAPDPVAFPEQPGKLTVFAAASLAEVFEAAADQLEATVPGLTVVFNFAGSQALVTQLAEGARADLFASANMTQMQAAIDADVIATDPVVFARNRLAIVVPKDNPAGISSLADLAKPEVQLVLADENVPVGQYARQALCLADARIGDYGDNFVGRVAANIVSNETNVKNVLARVQLGEADAGIVYVTDVTADVAADVTLIPIPDDVNIIASYPIAPVAGGNTDAAAAFISYLFSSEGQQLLVFFGFAPAIAESESVS